MEPIKQPLPFSQWTRPNQRRRGTKALVIHWVAKPGQTPAQVYNFWKARKDSYGSGHYVIGNDGMVYETIPPDEVAYHCGSRVYTEFAERKFGPEYTTVRSPNWLTVGIELCHLDWEGSFTAECLFSAQLLCAKLCRQYRLDPHKDIITHQMVVGWKECPKWYVDNPHDFEEFRLSVSEIL